MCFAEAIAGLLVGLSESDMRGCKDTFPVRLGIVQVASANSWTTHSKIQKQLNLAIHTPHQWFLTKSSYTPCPAWKQSQTSVDELCYANH